MIIFHQLMLREFFSQGKWFLFPTMIIIWDKFKIHFPHVNFFRIYSPPHILIVQVLSLIKIAIYLEL